MELNIQPSVLGHSYPGAESNQDRRTVRRSNDLQDVPARPQNAARSPALIDVREVMRVHEADDAKELHPVTHTIRPSSRVQTFQQIANNGQQYHSVDIYV